MDKTIRNQIILLLIILAIAAFFRFYKLADIPPGLYPDVAINGNDAATALRTGDFKIFYPENNGREGLFINLIAFSFSVLGISVWSIKIVAAITGFLTVLGLYLMTKELFRGKKQAASIALLSTFFLAIGFWHIVFSRLGFRAIMVPFFLVWGFYCLLKALRMSKTENTTIRFILYTLYFILAGLFFGLGFHTYISYRVIPAIWLVVLVIEIYNYRPRFKSLSANHPPSLNLFKQVFFKDGWWLWLVGLAAIIFAALPMVLYFYHNPQDFMGRTSQVSIFASGSPVKQLAINTIKALGMFNFRGDCNWRHNYACQPELFWPIGILFLIGLTRAIIAVFASIFGRRKAVSDIGEVGLPAADTVTWSYAQISLFLLAWFGALLLPEILSNEGLPHALRAIGAIPSVFIFAGIGGIWLINSSRSHLGHLSEMRSRTIIASAILIFSLMLVAQSYEYYFIDWSKNPEVRGAYTQHLVDVGNYLNDLPANAKKYVVVNEGGVPVPYPDGIPMPAQTVIFIQKTAGKENNTFYLKPGQLTQLKTISYQQETIFVPMEYDENIFNALKEKFPRGEILNQDNIWSFQIKN
jgi:4-amino-4-deoxy-L-arabinose transferase-like glycosyltransferase